MRTTTMHRVRQLARLLLIAPALVSGCKTEFVNTTLAQQGNPGFTSTGNRYAGWRVFQSQCASCHGISATGGEQAPDLLPIVRNLSARQFTALVLKRYDLSSGVMQGSENQSTLDTRIEEIMRRGDTPLEMPAWQSEPTVNAHILDLYAYLSARAEGSLGTERPQP